MTNEQNQNEDAEGRSNSKALLCADIPKGWIPLIEAVDFVNKNIMSKNPRFVLDNWDHKYTHIRVDMRTGLAIILPGNKSA
ncbi:hypothetical protein [Methylocaldum szegediense]|uniref:hypothetical protein n=1 Tax=Methylocaldum szegediense TaxID=73780 RepID=UPI000417EF02|nr:hypothetical protein [Methylocaldum szegediense]